MKFSPDSPACNKLYSVDFSSPRSRSLHLSQVIFTFLIVIEEIGTEESSEKEEDAYNEYGRQGELVRSPFPISLDRFGFHVYCAESFFFFTFLEVHNE